MSNRQRNPEIQVEPVIPYLIDDLTEQINLRERNFLRDIPVSVKVKGFSPFYISSSLENLDTSPTPIGITLIENQAQHFVPSIGYFVNMDLSFQFPILKKHQPNMSATLHFHEGSDVTIQNTDQGAIQTIADPDEIVNVIELDKDEAAMIFSSIGLPHSLNGDNFEHLLVELNNIQAVSFERKYTDILDQDTLIDVTHSALYAATTKKRVGDEDKKGLVQELTLNLSHLPKQRSLLKTPTPYRKTEFRFDRDVVKDISGWRYRGTYDVPLKGSDLTGVLVPESHTLIVPTIVDLDKALGYFKSKKL